MSERSIKSASSMENTSCAHWLCYKTNRDGNRATNKYGEKSNTIGICLVVVVIIHVSSSGLRTDLWSCNDDVVLELLMTQLFT